ncbi:MAG: transcriptional regulator [Nitrososphaerota archaeon]
MRSPCEKFVLDVMPSVRALIAKELIDKHALSQTEVARIIGTTRPAISQYLSAKRGFKMIRRLRTNPVVRELISRMASAIVKNEASKESVNDMVCEICRILESSKCEAPKIKKES